MVTIITIVTIVTIVTIIITIVTNILLCNPLQYSSKDLLQMESNLTSGINGLHFQSMRLVDDVLLNNRTKLISARLFIKNISKNC